MLVMINVVTRCFFILEIFILKISFRWKKKMLSGSFKIQRFSGTYSATFSRTRFALFLFYFFVFLFFMGEIRRGHTLTLSPNTNVSDVLVLHTCWVNTKYKAMRSLFAFFFIIFI